MTKAEKLKSRGNVSTPFTGRTDIPPEVVCAPFGEQVSLAMDNANKLAYAEGIACLAKAKRGKGQQAALTIPLRKRSLLPLNEATLHFVNICVQTKAKVRLLSAHSMPKLKMRRSA